MGKASLPVLLALVLLGNGLRSVVSSTVFVSEAAFASFLRISVDQTAAVIELLLGSVLLALLIAPRLLARFPARPLAGVMCLIAGLASVGLAALFWLSPPVSMRGAAVIVLFPVLGFSLATLAPLAQLMTGWGSERHTRLLTSTWAVAMPVAFLVTPQLVRVIAPRYGLDVFFMGFSAVVLLMIGGLMLVRPQSTAVAPLPQPATGGVGLAPIIVALLTFEVATTLATLLGITSIYVQGMGVIFLLALGYLIFRVWHLRRISGPAVSLVDTGLLGVLGFIFLVNVATTGFYDTAYLVSHLCSNTLIADRATLGALSQVVAAVGTSLVLARINVQQGLMLVGGFITALGLCSYLLYGSYPFEAVYIASRMVTGFGSGMLITAAVFACTNATAKNSSLSFFIAFVIILGTEVGLEAFEILSTVMGMFGASSAEISSAIFLVQCLMVLLAMPLVLRWSSRPTTLAQGEAA